MSRPVWLNFAGWFQCRLSTDPDPADEQRGVSGYAHAIAGEPDLDRVIRLQPPGTVRRPFCPEVGVSVRSVVVEGAPSEAHPLVGAAVELLDEAKFEGRNGVVAEDGFEPVVPFHLQVQKAGFRLRRRHADREEFPFVELQATGVQPGLADVGRATGIWDLWEVWQRRRTQIEEALGGPGLDEAGRVALETRLGMLADRGLTRFFPARMMYSIALRGALECTDPEGWLPGPASAEPWLVDFWFGGWDADAFCGYMEGTLRVELDGDAEGAAPPDVAQAAPSPAFAPPPVPPRAPRRP